MTVLRASIATGFRTRAWESICPFFRALLIALFVALVLRSIRSSMSAVSAEEREDSSSLLDGDNLSIDAIVGIDSVLIVESPLNAKLRKALALSEELRVDRRDGGDSASNTLAVSLEVLDVRMVNLKRSKCRDRSRSTVDGKTK